MLQPYSSADTAAVWKNDLNSTAMECLNILNINILWLHDCASSTKSYDKRNLYIHTHTQGIPKMYKVKEEKYRILSGIAGVQINDHSF